METKQKRNGFASGIGFILAASGSAIGLGNLWSFPNKTQTYGGAAFVFTYILSVLVIGSIVMIAELYIGRRAQANTVSAYKKVNKNFGWLGLFGVIIPFIIICYYCILGGYTVKFTVNSFSGNAGKVYGFVDNKLEVILFTALFIALCVFVVMAGVKGGIEKVSKILMPILLIILIAIAIYSLCLGEGVKEGLDFYLNPKFEKLGFEGVLAAMSQAFFSLSLGMGIMASYGSYTDKKINICKSISMICIFDTLVALLAGLAIFPAIYHYAGSTNGIKTDGLLLMFQTLPYVFESMGLFGKFLSFFFFAMVVIAALTSVISLLEVVTQFVLQAFNINRKKAVLIISCLCFVLTIPVGISLGLCLNDDMSMTIFGQDLLSLLDLITNQILMPVGALGACVAVGWLLDKPDKKSKLFSTKHLYSALKKDGLDIGVFGKIFAVMVKYVTPILILVVEVFGIIDVIEKNGINGVGIILLALFVCLIAIVTYFGLFKNKETGTNEDEYRLEKNKKS